MANEDCGDAAQRCFIWAGGHREDRTVFMSTAFLTIRLGKAIALGPLAAGPRPLPPPAGQIRQPDRHELPIVGVFRSILAKSKLYPPGYVVVRSCSVTGYRELVGPQSGCGRPSSGARQGLVRRAVYSAAGGLRSRVTGDNGNGGTGCD